MRRATSGYEVISSREQKAIETAAMVAAKLDIEIEIREAMQENDRSATGSCRRTNLRQLRWRPLRPRLDTVLAHVADE